MKIYRAGVEIYDIAIDSKTVLNKKLMGENKITCPIVVDSPLNLQEDDYITFQGENYYINRPPKAEKARNNELKYNIVFESEVYELLNKLFLLNGDSDFYLVGTLEDFIDQLIINANRDSSGWTKGNILATDRKNLYFNGESCRSVLARLANEFAVEFYLSGKTINFVSMLETPTAHSFEVGKGKGLYTLTRDNVDSDNTVTRAFIYGGTKNIDYNYRSGEKRLVWEDPVNSKRYLEDFSEYSKIVEKQVIFEDVFPHFEGVVSVVSGENGKVIKCTAIDFDINSQLMEGVTAKVSFLTGDLMGKDLEIESYNHATKEITLIPITEEGGLVLPGEAFQPKVGDVFTLIDIIMPQTYIDNAETELKIKGQTWLNYHKQLRVKYTLKQDPRHLRKNNISLKVGDLVTIRDTDLDIDKQIRIIGLKQNVEDPYTITCEIANHLEESWEREITAEINNTQAQVVLNKTESTYSLNINKDWVARNFAKLTGGNILSGTQEVIGDLNVQGNINQTGQAYITYAEKVEVSNNLMQLNMGEVGSQITGVIPGTAIPFSGIEINRGTPDPYYLGVVEGATPLLKLGKKDSLVAIAAREDVITDGHAMQWDEINKKMIGVAAVRDSLKLGGRVAADYWHKDNSNRSDKDWTVSNLTAYGRVIGVEHDAVDGEMTTIAFRFIEGRGWGYNRENDRVFYNAANGIIPFFADTSQVGINVNIGSPDYASGLTGADWRITKSGFAEFDEVEIRKGLTVHELIVARERSVNGGIITSVANGTVKSISGDVVTLKGQYNSFVIGDRVRLQQWEASTRYMEAEVTAVNGMTITLGNYINSTRPLPNEDLVQWGHISDTSRQNFLYQTARGDNAAYFAVMQGVNSSSLTDKQVLRIGNLGGYANDGYGIASKYGGNTYFELSNTHKSIAGITFDYEKFTAGNVQIWKTGDIINTASGTPFAFYGNGNFSLGKGQIGYNSATNVLSFADSVKLQWENYTNSAVDAIEIGGRNLLKNSAAEKNTTRFTLFPVWNIFPGHVGREVTISFDMKCTIARGIYVYAYQSNGISIKDQVEFTVSTPNVYERFSFTTTVKDYGDDGIYSDGEVAFYDYVGEQNYSIKNIKVEWGNKATDWTPAPEDVDASIATKITSEQATVITSNTIQTTNILAENLRVNFVNVQGTLSANQIDALSITGDKIAAGTITTTKLAAYTITAEKIATGTITADKLNTASVQASLITTDYIEGLELNFDKGVIGGWNINTNSLSYTIGIGGSTHGIVLDPANSRIQFLRNVAQTSTYASIAFGQENDNNESTISPLIVGGTYLGLKIHSKDQVQTFSTRFTDHLLLTTGTSVRAFDLERMSDVSARLRIGEMIRTDVYITGSTSFKSVIHNTERTGSTYYCNDYSHTIIATGANYIYLPSNPEEGREIRIKRDGTGEPTIKGNGKTIKYHSNVGVSELRLNATWGQAVILQFDGTYWQAMGDIF